MQIDEYQMTYYNPWDTQHLGYLTVTYEPEDFAKETERLGKIGCTEYLGYYGVTGFAAEYELLAMDADSYEGFAYAICTGKNRITYVVIRFCNYFLDLETEQYIPKKYLPTGFDASKDNEYKKSRGLGEGIKGNVCSYPRNQCF